MRDTLEPFELCDALHAAGVPLDRSPESDKLPDLYAMATPEAFTILARYQFRDNVSTFVSPLDGKTWFSVPFAFRPGTPTLSREG